MRLQPPKRTSEGFHLAIDPLITPAVQWNPVALRWDCSSDMVSWITTQRSALVEELLVHKNWFSHPPRRETLDTLFVPWVITDKDSGESRFVCPLPTLQEVDNGANIRAEWSLDGILMTAKAISPVWSISSVTKDTPSSDTITLFESNELEADGREIQFHEIESVIQSAPTKLKGREWEARKFVGKERVREARLKAQIARRIAKKEESRYYEQFGDPEDGESRISEFDLTDSDSDSKSEYSSESEHVSNS